MMLEDAYQNKFIVLLHQTWFYFVSIRMSVKLIILTILTLEIIVQGPCEALQCHNCSTAKDTGTYCLFSNSTTITCQPDDDHFQYVCATIAYILKKNNSVSTSWKGCRGVPLNPLGQCLFPQLMVRKDDDCFSSKEYRGRARDCKVVKIGQANRHKSDNTDDQKLSKRQDDHGSSGGGGAATNTHTDFEILPRNISKDVRETQLWCLCKTNFCNHLNSIKLPNETSETDDAGRSRLHTDVVIPIIVVWVVVKNGFNIG